MAGGNGSSLLDQRAARRALSEARGKQKLDLLFSAPDPGKLVRSLPPEELYLALLDIGPDDAAEIVAMSTPEQFRHFIDMAAWPGADEGPKPTEVLRWLRLAREGRGHNDARFRGQLSSLDVELLALVLRREMKVYDLGEDDHARPANPELAWYTPDRRFLLEFTGEAEFSAMRHLIEDLYQRDDATAGRLIEATRWEQPAELEEAARRWRNGRLRDLGVPELEEALAFYARPAEAPKLPETTSTALTVPKRNLLEAALAQLSGSELEDAEESLVYAANAALVANRVPLDDAAEVREQLAQARATLALGLELLSGGDATRAARVLVETPIRNVFQTAMGEAYRLQTRARTIAASARLPQAESATLLDEPLGDAVDALLKPRPLFAEPGQRRPRAFGSRAEVAGAEVLLDESEAVVELLEALGISPAALGPKAEEAGLGPAAFKASDAIWALVESQIRGEPFSLRALAQEGRLKSPGFVQGLDDLFQNAMGGSHSETLQRAAQRIRARLIS